MLDHDLEQMPRNSGSVSRRDLVAALCEAGFEVAHRSKHETWAKGDSVIAVPWTPKGSGTIRAIVTAIIEARKGESDGPSTDRRSGLSDPRPPVPPSGGTG